MDACLSFTTILNFTDTDTYTDHVHGSEITDLWMASFTEFAFNNSSIISKCYLLTPLPQGRAKLMDNLTLVEQGV